MMKRRFSALLALLLASVMLLGMNANKSKDSLRQGLLPFLVSLCIFFLLFTGSSIWYLKKKDVRA